MSTNFWRNVVYCLKVSGPLVKVLRLVDGKKRPPMGYIYKAMDRAKEAIQKSFNENEDEYKPILAIIDAMWEVQLNQPLHAAEHFLNPSIYYEKQQENNDLDNDAEVMDGLFKCITRLVPTLEEQEKITMQLTLYKEAGGFFGNAMTIRQRNMRAPADWWSSFGSSTPNLQKFAIRVLSLTCSSSGCERNWSVFEHDIDENNEWLTGNIDGEVGEDDFVWEGDDLTWEAVSRARGDGVASHNFRPRQILMASSGRGSSSSRRPTPLESLDDEEAADDMTDEDGDEGYNSNDEKDDDFIDNLED